MIMEQWQADNLKGTRLIVPTLGERQQWLRRFERFIRTHVDELCSLVSAEIGKSEWEVLSTELMPLLAAIRWHTRNLKRLLRPRRLRGGAFWQISQKHRVHRMPLGTVGIIATWNYPIQLLGVQLVQAIAAGNRVVVKPSEHAPWSQKRLLELARAAGLDSSRLWWTDATREEGARLLREESLDHVVFTGSAEVGREVARVCAEQLLSSTLELSGRDSALVLDDADVDLAAASIWNAVVMNAGQTCMAPRRVLVMRSAYPKFVSELTRFAAAARPVRLVRAEEVSHCIKLARDAVAAGGRNLLCELEPVDEYRMRPLAIADCPRDSELAEGRHFGPVVAVIPCEDLPDALSVHEGSDQKLATSVYTRSPARVEAIAELFGSGLISINDCVLPAGHPASPISGRGASGWGSSQGIEGLLALTRPVTVSRTGWLLRLPTEIPTPGIQSLLRRMMRRGRGGDDGNRGTGDDVPNQEPAKSGSVRPPHSVESEGPTADVH